MANLYLISTPIGNLKDITFRSIETLWSVPLIICEDTREAGKLLKEYESYQTGDKPRLLSYNDHNRDQQIPFIIHHLISGNDAAFISDRGTPLISDPGYKLVQEILSNQELTETISVVPIPGANAVLPAIQLSGMPPDKFFFVGFLPRKPGKLKTLINELPNDTTIVAYEAPNRLVKSLEAMYETHPNTHVAISFEITKMYEHTYRGPVHGAIASFKTAPPKGEIALTFIKK